MSDTIIALDLGRHKSVACVSDRGTGAHAFRELDTKPGALDRLLAAHPGAVVVEACANAGWVHDRPVAAGHPVKVANTAAEAWKFKHLKRKTDRDDALRLAQLEALGQLPTVAMPDPATRQRRVLIACRQELVGRRVACQNRIRALFAAAGLATPSGHRAWTEAGLLAIGSHAKPPRGVRSGGVVARGAPVGAGRVRGAGGSGRGGGTGTRRGGQSGPGDGAAGDDPQVGAAHGRGGGGAPRGRAAVRQCEAGGRVRGSGAAAVPERGDGPEGSDHAARPGAAAQAAGGVRVVHAAVQRVGAGGVRAAEGGGPARKKPAIVALARKVLVRCWAMLRSGEPWRDAPDPAPDPAPGRGRRAE